MRKLSLIAAAGLMAAPLVAQAMPLNELLADKGLVAAEGGGGGGRTWYDGGTRLEFPDAGFDMKFNLMIQSLYAYTNVDSDEEDSGDDTSSFEMRNVRLEFTGNLLNKKFSYELSNDFGDGSDLKDAWLQWNLDDAAQLRMGQFKMPYSRQALAHDAMLQMVDRGIAHDFFAGNGDLTVDAGDDLRNQGLMLHGDLGGPHYYLGIFNGQSDGEGRNSVGVDNDHTFAGMITANIGDYGSREWEGDWAGTSSFAMTMGAAALYGQGTSAGGDFDKLDLNADWGARCNGFSAQVEAYYRDLDPDAGDSLSDFGAYGQVGFFFVPQEWEGAFRFSYLNPDSDSGLFDDAEEYSAALNYYLDGHHLKIQTGVTWAEANFENSDVSELEVDLLFAGYF